MSFWSDPVTYIEELLRGWLTAVGLQADLTQVLLYLIGGLLLALLSLGLVIFLIWVERKVVGRVQDRLGPNRVGPWGIFQTFADILKIFTKEYITPTGADVIPYNIAPILAVAAVIMVWAVIPFSPTVRGSRLDVGVLYVMAVGALGEMAVVMAGWGSNNKFALLGAFRAVAQLISYGIPMAVSLLIPVMLGGSMSLSVLVEKQDIWFIALAPLAALIFFTTSIAEVGRAPFDLVEAESELVAGFNIEYSGLKFGFFFVGEFLHAFTISLLFAAVFLGGWRGPWAATIPVLGFIYFFIKTALVYFLVILIRATLPRFRIDQMMDVNWKVLTPLALVALMVTALAVKLMDGQTNWVRIPVLLALNIALLLGASWLLDRSLARHPRPEVGDRSRPVARPPQKEAQAETGGQS
jgi:NADH-quinone oxidoreductase subunit H